jgi:hypothetical protein
MAGISFVMTFLVGLLQYEEPMKLYITKQIGNEKTRTNNKLTERHRLYTKLMKFEKYM